MAILQTSLLQQEEFLNKVLEVMPPLTETFGLHDLSKMYHLSSLPLTGILRRNSQPITVARISLNLNCSFFKTQSLCGTKKIFVVQHGSLF